MYIGYRVNARCGETTSLFLLDVRSIIFCIWCINPTYTICLNRDVENTAGQLLCHQDYQQLMPQDTNRWAVQHPVECLRPSRTRYALVLRLNSKNQHCSGRLFSGQKLVEISIEIVFVSKINSFVEMIDIAVV